jgi:hypothetical protein
MLAKAVEKSNNSKIGEVSATYVTQAACPRSCPLLEHGCYAEGGRVGKITRQLNNYAREAGATLTEIAQAEADAIDGLKGVRPLRLRVVGDSTSNSLVRPVAAAASRYRKRGGGPVWAYTHGHREVDREAWGPDISVLASCETPEDVKKAHERGYATAVVVPEFKQATLWEEDGVKYLPCPNQTRGRKCTECRLCWNDKRLHKEGISIAFSAHGNRTRMAKETVLRKREACKA